MGKIVGRVRFTDQLSIARGERISATLSEYRCRSVVGHYSQTPGTDPSGTHYVLDVY